MRKASSSFLILFFAALLVTFQSNAQPARGPRWPQGPIITPAPLPAPGPARLIHETVRQNIRPYDRLNLAMLLRLSYHEEKELEVHTLSLNLQTVRPGHAQVQLLQHGRLLATETISRNLPQVRLLLPIGTMMEDLELTATSDLFIESISAEVSSFRPSPLPLPSEQQVRPNQMVTLQVSQAVRGYAVIDLEEIARQQLGLTFRGANIQRVVVHGRPPMYGRSASVQVHLNGRIASDSKFLNPNQGQVPLPVHSIEEVRDLGLLVNGDAEIFEIRVRVGNVRPQQPQGPSLPQRIIVQQEVNGRMPLELSRLLPYSQQLIRSITIEARTFRQVSAQLSVVGIYGEFQGVFQVRQNSARVVITLRRPMMPSELRLESLDSVLVEAIELEVEPYRY